MVIQGMLTLNNKGFNMGIKAAMKELKKLDIDLQGVSKNIKKGFDGVRWALETLDPANIQQLEDAIDEVGNQLNNAISYAGGLKDNMLTIKDMGIDAFKSIKEYAEQYKYVYDDIKQWGTDTFQKISEKMNDKFGEAFSKTAQWSSETFGAISQKLMDRYGETFNSIKQYSVDTFSNINSQVSGKLNEVYSNVKQKGIESFEKIKQKSQDFEEKLKDIQASGVAAFASISNKLEAHRGTIDSVKNVISDVEANVAGFKDSLVNAFEGAQPAVEWLNANGLPGVGDLVSNVADKSMDLYNFIDGNWNKFQPIIQGISGALEYYETATVAVQKATEIYTKVTDGLIKVQGFLNTVMNMSPFALVALAVVGLIAAGVLLWKNWDTVKEKALSLWESIQSIFGNVASFFQNVFNNALEGVLSFFRPAAELINMVIDGINQIKFTVPDWIPKYGGMSFGIEIPKIPAFAMGTTYSQGGLALLHERGGEIRRLSSGETIIPADKSQRLIERISNAPNITININGSNITTDEVVNEMVTKLKLTLANM